MDTASESVYRDCRRAFIAAAEAAHVDTIARLHPSRDKDGKPLFMDSVALGPRLAGRALLAIANGASGSALATQLLKADLPLPPDGRLVLVHAADPAAFAGIGTDSDWSAAMLAAVAREDLSRVRKLAILPLAASALPSLSLADAIITLLPAAESLGKARGAIMDFFGP
jgi:hypothetical protein